MALIKSCINHPDISKDLYFHQALFTCLYMSPLEDQLFQEVLFVSIFFFNEVIVVMHGVKRSTWNSIFVERNVIKSAITLVLLNLELV